MGFCDYLVEETMALTEEVWKFMRSYKNFGKFVCQGNWEFC